MNSLITRSKSGYDGATPAGASMAVHSLLRLDKLLAQSDLREKAEITLDIYYHQIESAPSGSAQLLCELDFLLSTPKELVIAGQREDKETKAALRTIHSRFIPNKIMALLDPRAENLQETEAFIPLLEGKKQINDKTTIYVCENYTCKAPTTDLAELESQL